MAGKKNVFTDKNGRATDLTGFIAGIAVATIVWLVVIAIVPLEFFANLGF